MLAVMTSHVKHDSDHMERSLTTIAQQQAPLGGFLDVQGGQTVIPPPPGPHPEHHLRQA